MINFFAPVNDLGYGHHARGWIGGMYKFRKDLSLTTIGQMTQTLSPDEIKVIMELTRNADRFSRKDPSLMIFHEQFANTFVGDPMVMCPVFETDKLDAKSKNMLKNVDHLILTSKWAQDVVKENGVDTPSSVIPEGVDPNIFYAEPCTENKYFTFVTVGKYEVRKSSQEIIVAFCQEFENSEEKVRLVAHMFNPFVRGFLGELSPIFNRLGFSMEEGENGDFVAKKNNMEVVIPVQPFGTQNEVSQLYKTAHCGVFPSKAEGWNLPLMECLACSTPAIATLCTGHTEYLSKYDDNLLIKDLTKVTANDGMWFKGDRGEWYTFKTEELQAKMRWAFENRKEIRSIASRYADYIKREFSWGAAGKKLNEFFKDMGK